MRWNAITGCVRTGEHRQEAGKQISIIQAWGKGIRKGFNPLTADLGGSTIFGFYIPGERRRQGKWRRGKKEEEMVDRQKRKREEGKTNLLDILPHMWTFHQLKGFNLVLLLFCLLIYWYISPNHTVAVSPVGEENNNVKKRSSSVSASMRLITGSREHQRTSSCNVRRKETRKRKTPWCKMELKKETPVLSEQRVSESIQLEGRNKKIKAKERGTMTKLCRVSAVSGNVQMVANKRTL